MASFSYTTGNPTNLTGGATALMSDIQGPFVDIKTRLNNSGTFDEGDLTATMVQKLGLNVGSQIGRGKSIIATTESRTNVAYGTLTTPDQVTGIVLPTDGQICVAYQATWQESVSGAARAAIFVGANQLKLATAAAAPAVQEASTGGGVAATDTQLAAGFLGLESGAAAVAYTGDVTTGQVNAGLNRGGPCYIFAAAGTYTISVQFKSSSGSVTVKNRKLWVWTIGF